MSSVATVQATDAFDYLCELIHARSAIVLDATKTYLIESRLGPLVKQHGMNSLGELVEALRARPYGTLQKQVVEAMTTNETSFFRDIHPFEALKKVVLPEILAKRSAARTLNIWCGACSSGQEPYSILMILREQFPQLASWQVRLVASDLSQQMLDRTQHGMYSQLEVSRGLPAPLLVKYFTKQGMQWQISHDLSRSLELVPLNLVETWPALPKMDIIFLRNVLIYFSIDTKKKILGRLRQQLTPDGYLFLGGSETTLNLDDQYERLQLDKTVCYRPKQASAQPVTTGVGAKK